MISSYGKVLAVGSKYHQNFFDDRVVIQEKIDGSQFSFAMRNGELHCRSKNKGIVVDCPDNMFSDAVETVKELFEQGLLRDGWIYRGEYLQKPKHNALCYDRIPEKHIILFDVERNPGTGDYLTPPELEREAKLLGLESVPCFWDDFAPKDYNLFLRQFLERTSVLGGQKVEGVVVKNYTRPDIDGKLLKCKLVSDDFKEVHKVTWGESNPGRGDRIQSIITAYRQPTRWNKAIQHMAEDGVLTESPKDIGQLMKGVQYDIKVECKEEIKELLWEAFSKDIVRGCTAGLPEWYKRRLLNMPNEGDE